MILKGKTCTLRLLTPDDGLISFKWRNDPEIWRFTGSRPDREITPEMECSWLEKILKNVDEARFAIVCKHTDQYIGNIQLTNIDSDKAEYHIFIGDSSYWGKGIAFDASCLILNYAFINLKLKSVYLVVNPLHISAIKLYEKLGFIAVDNTIKMILNQKNQAFNNIYHE